MTQPILDLSRAHRTDVAHHTFVRVITKDQFAQMRSVPFRLMTADLVAILVLDLPDGIIPLTQSSVERFGGWDELFAIGIDNLAAMDLIDIDRHGDATCSFTAVTGETALTASKLLVGADLIEQADGFRPTDDGYLFAAPHSRLFAYSPIRDASVLPAIRALLRFAAHEFSGAEREDRLSPHIFWQRGERIEQLSTLEDGGALSVTFSDDCRSVLERVSGQAL
ncbi:hypothetical protein [Helcobacillus massiliensis]|uniref:hypothetical protein n=1 Tax=Helcobacillus massiliensis TaxID=521392 RepID=UPI002553A69F|nr:hypothetical protein [Helcobacillus massiliensis]MDK7742303.1 hypothetical protein [Helcobacillus massiliensis]WOO93552.1 hypothetical protein R3I40_02885 [Helcobacillus massiliensis]